MSTKIVQLTENAIAEIRAGLKSARVPRDPQRRDEDSAISVPELLPVLNTGTDAGADGGMCEFYGLHTDGFRVLACRPRRGGLSSIGLWAGYVPAGGDGYAWHLSGSIVRSAVLGALAVPVGNRIGCVKDSFVGALNPLGRFLVRGYDSGTAIIEITEPPVDRKLVQLPGGQIVSVREIEFGAEYDISVSAGIVSVSEAGA